MNTEPIYFTDLSEEEARKVEDFLKKHYSYLGSFFRNFQRIGKERVTSKIISFENENSEKFVLKQEFFFDSDGVAGIVKLYNTVNYVSEQLREQGVPFPRILNSDNGSSSVFSGDVFSTVQEFIPGEHFCAKDAQIRNLGAELANFHVKGQELLAKNPDLKNKLLSNIPVEKPFETSVKVYREKLKDDIANNSFHFSSTENNCGQTKICDYIRANLDKIDLLVEEVEAFFSSEEGRTLPEGLLHFDFNPNNCLFSESGDLTAFLDLGYVNGPLYGFCVFDIADSMVKFTDNFISNRPGEDYKSFVNQFLKGYNKVRQMTSAEHKGLIPAMTRMQLFRILRILRRHYYENGRMDGAMAKVGARLFPGMLKYKEMYGFLLKT